MNDWKPRMEKTVRHLAEQLAGIRPDTLSVGFLETFRVPIRGNTLPLAKMAVIGRQGERLVITPFDPASAGAIVKALTEAKLNAYATNPKVGLRQCPAAERRSADRDGRGVSRSWVMRPRSPSGACGRTPRKQIAAWGRGSQRAVQEATDAAIVEIDRLVGAKLAAPLEANGPEQRQRPR